MDNDFDNFTDFEVYTVPELELYEVQEIIGYDPFGKPVYATLKVIKNFNDLNEEV